jgi:hypothetical protein
VTSKEVPKDGATMASNRQDIIEDFQEHMRKTGGAASDWLIGTAQDSRSPFFRNHIGKTPGKPRGKPGSICLPT